MARNLKSALRAQLDWGSVRLDRLIFPRCPPASSGVHDQPGLRPFLGPSGLAKFNREEDSKIGNPARNRHGIMKFGL
jgi:hypothetical protein